MWELFARGIASLLSMCVCLAQARMSGGLPQGVQMSPEAMQSAMESMARMDPKDLEGMVSMMQPSSGGASSSITNNAGTLPQMGPGSDQFKQSAAALQVIESIQLAVVICASVAT